jgi:predicted nucleic acid-binding protein
VPLVYADSSALFAYFHPRDEFARAVTAAARANSPDFVYWSFLKFELRHNLRQVKVDRYGQVAWNALRAGERTRVRLRWQDLNCERVLESAESLSQQHALASGAGSGDFLHVAAARKLDSTLGLDEFWTCDSAQAAAARKAGLKTRLFVS